MQAKAVRLLPILLLLSLSACTPNKEVKPDPKPDQPVAVVPDTKPTDPRVQEALALIEQGEHLRAAQLYLELADAAETQDERADWLLLAAGQQGKGEDLDEVLATLGRLTVFQLSPLQDFHRRVILGETRVARGEFAQALAALHLPPAAGAQIDWERRYHAATASAAMGLGLGLRAARSLRTLDTLLLDQPEQQRANQLRILRAYSSLGATALPQTTDPEERGWLALVSLLRTSGYDSAAMAPLLDSWRAAHPDHPLRAEVLLDYLDDLARVMAQPKKIAVLLPLSGRLQRVGEAVRDGILAAHYHLPVAARPQLSFRDTTDTLDITALLQELAADGHDFAVGPLSKSNVEQLVQAGVLPMPVLALNRVELDRAPPAQLFQYGLAPEDDAVQAADRAWSDGRRRVATLASADDFGRRIATAFSRRWQALGGAIADRADYPPKANDFGPQIQSMLLIDRSKQRRRALQNMLGKRLEFEPRRREDVDAILMIARGATAQLMRPQIQFQYAADLPVYSTSHAWNGTFTDVIGRDLKDLYVPEMPWLGTPDPDSPLSSTKLGPWLPAALGPYRRLFAMGLDAYRLSGQLGRLQLNPAESFSGATGELRLDASRQVHRQLVWLQIKSKGTKALGLSPRLGLQTATMSAQPHAGDVQINAASPQGPGVVPAATHTPPPAQQ